MSLIIDRTEERDDVDMSTSCNFANLTTRPEGLKIYLNREVIVNNKYRQKDKVVREKINIYVSINRAIKRDILTAI